MIFKILLVEDDVQTAQMIDFYLKQEKFDVIKTLNGFDGEAALYNHEPHLAILDVMLPGIDGLELCRRIRQKSNIPILMLTAKATEMDKAIGLGIGADDYLTKPFSPTELIARIKAMLRRTYQLNEAASKTDVLGGPRLKLHEGKHKVTIDGEIVQLTPIEFDLLRILMANPGWAFTRSHLLNKLWGYDYSGKSGEETITAHISNLRRKLNDDGHLIRTIRGVGYSYQE